MKTRFQRIAMLAGLAAVYCLAARLGLSMRVGNVSASPVWPASGLALAAVLLLGYRVWPAVAAGALLASLTMPGFASGRPGLAAFAALGVAVGSTLEALAGGWLVQRFANGRAAFGQPQSILKFVGLAAMLSTTISPSIGLTSLVLASLETGYQFGPLWYTSWLGGATSAIVVTPLVLVWSTKRLPALTSGRVAELTGLLLMGGLTCGLLFRGWSPGDAGNAPLALLLMPSLIWPALRFGQRGTATTVFMLAVLALVGTLDGSGPFVVSTRNTSLLLLQEFIGVAAVLALVLAADVAQRQRADASLRASEQRYRELFESSPQPMWVYDRETLRFLAVNSAAIRHYGYPREAFLEMRLPEVQLSEDSLVAPPGPANTLTDIQPLPQNRHRKRDGTLIDVEIASHTLVFDHRPATMVATTDVTARRRAERLAAAFSDLGRRLSAADTPKEAAQIIVETADRLFGWDACTFDLCEPDSNGLGTVLCLDTIDGERRDVTCECTSTEPSALARQIISQGAQLILRPEPAAFPPGTSPIGDKTRPSASLMYVPLRQEQRTMGVLSVQSYQPKAYTHEDLKALQALADHCGGALERIRAEMALRESDERLHFALAASKMGTWIRELNGKDRFLLSPELEAMVGLEPGEYPETEQALFRFIHPEDRELVRQAFARLTATRQDYEVEFRFTPRNRPVKWMLGRGRAYCDTEGKLVRLAGVAVDITARKEAEQEILRLNADLEERVRQRTAQLEAINKELEAFSYSVSHDLRAPLRTIHGFSEVLLDDYSGRLDLQGQEFLCRIRDSCQRMDKLIQDLLALSRLGRSEMQRQRVNLSALVESISTELRKTEPRRKVAWSIAPALRAWGDERLLRVVLDNLLRNAWKFTSKQTKPRIEFGAARKPEPAFFVRDNGAGFDMAYSTKLFGVFQRLHSASEFPGNGVGLATVQRIVNRHGGRIWATGAVNRGATFYFTLPAKADF
jgi:PAS domain S-box-containing protein